MMAPAKAIASAATMALCLMIAPARGTPIKSENAACARLKAVFIARYRVRPSLIDYCDRIDGPRAFYVIVLHSRRDCDSICSTIMGWYAVEKTSGRIFEWDPVDDKVGRRVRARHR